MTGGLILGSKDYIVTRAERERTRKTTAEIIKDRDQKKREDREDREKEKDTKTKSKASPAAQKIIEQLSYSDPKFSSYAPKHREVEVSAKAREVFERATDKQKASLVRPNTDYFVRGAGSYASDPSIRYKRGRITKTRYIPEQLKVRVKDRSNKLTAQQKEELRNKQEQLNAAARNAAARLRAGQITTKQYEETITSLRVRKNRIQETQQGTSRTITDPFKKDYPTPSLPPKEEMFVPIRPTSPKETIRPPPIQPMTPRMSAILQPKEITQKEFILKKPDPQYKKQYNNYFQSLSEDTDLFVSGRMAKLENRTSAMREYTQKPVEEMTLLTSKKDTIMPEVFKKAETKIKTQQLTMKQTEQFTKDSINMARLGSFQGLKAGVIDPVFHPIRTGKGIVDSIFKPFETGSMLVTQFKKNPLAMEGAIVGGAFGFSKTTAAANRLIQNTFIVPINKRFNPNYVSSKNNIIQLKNQQIEMKPVHTDPITRSKLIKDFGNTEQWTIHATEGLKFDNGGLLKLESNPTMAKGFRKQNDLLHFYRSLPTDDGNPQAYMAYMSDVSPIDYPSQQGIGFNLFKPKKQLLLEKAQVAYIKPLKGESMFKYAQRTGKLSGVTQLPAENIFSRSIERQAITPSKFTGRTGTEYKGSILQKQAELGFTYFEQKPLDATTFNTKVFSSKSTGGYGLKSLKAVKDYYDTSFSKVHLTEVKTLRLLDYNPTQTKSFNNLRLNTITKPNRVLNMAKYTSSYGTQSISFSSYLPALSIFSSSRRSPSRSLSRSLSPSISLSRSPSRSLSRSLSSSLSPSISPSRSPSRSPSQSYSIFSSSPSLSRSLSPSLSPSISPSRSPSRSPSHSESIFSSSPSRSPSRSYSSSKIRETPTPLFTFPSYDKPQQRKGRPMRSVKSPRGYAPSLVAFDFNIKAPKGFNPKLFIGGGLGIRPLI